MSTLGGKPDSHWERPSPRPLVQILKGAKPSDLSTKFETIVNLKTVRAGGFIFLSGIVSIDAATGERAMGTVAGEMRHILTNMTHMLESPGSSMSKVVKINVLLRHA
jgi:enamine deaminase RidA (YjgF/YER057c/UK114 family)